ncbi:hypothetical protein [Terrimonas ginsenosidimutans]|nr:hypothetical protein [Terrimonas ginsenosidimutans]
MSSSTYVTGRLFTVTLPLFSREILSFSHGFSFAYSDIYNREIS